MHRSQLKPLSLKNKPVIFWIVTKDISVWIFWEKQKHFDNLDKIKFHNTKHFREIIRPYFSYKLFYIATL